MNGKKVQTVLGAVDVDSVGLTLTHEHLSMNLVSTLYHPPPADQLHLTNCPISDNIQWIAQNPLSHRGNVILNDAEAESLIMDEVKLFKSNGGGTIVDQSSLGLNRKDAFLKTVAKETAVNIVAGAGFYRYVTQPDWTRSYSMEQMADITRRQLNCPVDDDTQLRCGLIGEVGCDWPLADFEKRSVECSGVVQSESGCPVLVHPPHHKEGVLEVVRIYEEAGGKADKLVIAHLDWPIAVEESLAFASECPGVIIELDSFGSEYGSVFNFPAMPSDEQRMDMLVQLINEGHENRIVLSHDLWAKHKLSKFGGHGYTHLKKSIIPRLVDRGISLDVIHKLTVQNPANWQQGGEVYEVRSGAWWQQQKLNDYVPHVNSASTSSSNTSDWRIK